MSAIRFQSFFQFLFATIVCFYVLDESFILKGYVVPLMTGLFLVNIFFGLTLDRKHAFDSMAFFGVAVFIIFYIFSLLFGTNLSQIPINVTYPLIFAFGLITLVEKNESFIKGLYCGLVILLCTGWFRFVTLEGGEITEHLLGYWGIKYLPATRNLDALVPLLTFCISVKHYIEPNQVKSVKIISALIITISALALILTYSRSAWLAAFLFILVFLRSNDNRKVFIIWASIVSFMVIFTIYSFSLLIEDYVNIESIIERFFSIFSTSDGVSSNSERLRLIIYSVEASLISPIYGLGVGEYNSMMVNLGYLDLRNALHSENLFLDILVMHGFPVLFSFLFIIINRSIKVISGKDFLKFSLICGLLLWLQMNSEIQSLLFWSLLIFLLCDSDKYKSTDL